MNNEIIIYQGKTGAIGFKGDLKKETLWADQSQIVKLFEVDQSVVSRHIKNVFRDKEIDPKSNMQKMHNAKSDKPVVFYSLDVVLSVGYRTNSKVAIEFRKWATKILRAHITEGYTINKARITKNYNAFLEAVNNVKKLLLQSQDLKTEDVLELIKMFANTWVSLQAFDKSELPKNGATKKEILITSKQFFEVLAKLKKELIVKKEASELFGIEKEKEIVGGIIGNVFQSFDGNDLYPTIEEKAAHLLYFIVKNHPFIDGNKRSGAFSFVWFLNKAKILDTQKLSPVALTVLTLLVAESNPKDKNRVVGLILLLLKK